MAGGNHRSEADTAGPARRRRLNLADLRHVRPVPMLTAVLSVVIMLGTWVGQSGHSKDEAYASSEVRPGTASNGPGMDNMPGMSMPGMSMPGMVMPGGAGTDSTQTSAAMPGKAGSAPAPTGQASAGATAKPDAMPGMGGADPMAGMSMGTKDMAAMMPGGYHLDCKADSCSLILSDKASGPITVLGLHVKLVKLEASAVSLDVDGSPVTVKSGHPGQVHRVRITVEQTGKQQATLRFRKA